MDKKTCNRKKIIGKSIHIMYLRGYNATSVKDISNAANIPKGSFYYYFNTKEEYVIEALNYYINHLNHDDYSILNDKEVDPLERIKKFYLKKIENMETNNYKFGCFVGNLTQEMADVNDDISKLTNKLHDNLSLKILNCILQAQDQYGYKPILDPKILADYINNSWQGALLRMKSSENRLPLDEFYNVLIYVLLK